jgi:hypothetical protein
MPMIVTALILLTSSISATGHPCKNKETLKRLAANSEIIVLAEIISDKYTGDGIYSGFIGVTYQYITYQIKSTLKGNLNIDTIQVAFVLYRGSLLIDKVKPQVLPNLFQKGKTQLLFINVGQRFMKGEQGNYYWENIFVAGDENCAAIVPDSKQLEIVRNAISKKSIDFKRQ